jgi:hypothetical protein
MHREYRAEQTYAIIQFRIFYLVVSSKQLRLKYINPCRELVVLAVRRWISVWGFENQPD